MDDKRIEKEMQELESKLNYKFKNISWLANAMASIKIDVEGAGDHHSEYSNERLATVGDAILDFVIADVFYNDQIKTKGEITTKRSKLVNNRVMHQVMLKEGFINYAYNDLHFYKDKGTPKHEKVVSKKHDPYIEAITAAIYYDSGFEDTRKWIIATLVPLLEKYS